MTENEHWYNFGSFFNCILYRNWNYRYNFDNTK